MNIIVRNSIIITSVFLLGGVSGYYLAPTKKVTVESIKYVDRVVEKKIYVQDSTTKKNTTEVKTVTTKPDGTKIEEVKTVDNDTITVNQKTTDNTDSTKSLDKLNSTTIEYRHNETIISVAAKMNTNEIGKIVYGVEADHQVLGPIMVGAFGFMDGTLGAKIGLVF